MSIQTSPRRGELYWLDWIPARGSEQAGRRPGLVISNDTGNHFSSVVIVAAITSQQARRRYPFHVRVPSSSGSGLRRDSIVMCEQLMTASKDRLLGRIGVLPLHLMAEVDDALRIVLSLS